MHFYSQLFLAHHKLLGKTIQKTRVQVVFYWRSRGTKWPKYWKHLSIYFVLFRVQNVLNFHIFGFLIYISYRASFPQQKQKLQRCRAIIVNIFNLLQLFKATEIWRLKGEDEFNEKQRKKVRNVCKKRSREREQKNSQKNKKWSKWGSAL